MFAIAKVFVNSLFAFGGRLPLATWFIYLSPHRFFIAPFWILTRWVFLMSPQALYIAFFSVV